MYLSTIFRKLNDHKRNSNSPPLTNLSPIKFRKKEPLTLLSLLPGTKAQKAESVSTSQILKQNNSLVFPKTLKQQKSMIIPLLPLLNLTRSNTFLSKIKNPVISERGHPKHTYYVIPGNNSTLIKKCLSNRPYWKEGFSSKTCNLLWAPVSSKVSYANYSTFNSFIQIVNHYEHHSHLTNKSNLFVNLIDHCEKKNIDIFTIIPFTIIIQFDHRNFCKQFRSFMNFFHNITDYLKVDKKRKYNESFSIDDNNKLGSKTLLYINSNLYNERNLWLVKATNLNRGQCIKVSDSIDDIQRIIKNFYNGVKKTFNQEQLIESKDLNITTFRNSTMSRTTNGIGQKCYWSNKAVLQKYIEKPLLYQGRKFDIRIWVLLTHKLDLYVFKQGHLKTSSELFDLHSNDTFIHLTNYSVQKYNQHFEKYEDGNEISFEEFQMDLDEQRKFTSVRFLLFPQLCEIVSISMESVITKINASERKHCFEIFGYDFMLDQDCHPYLLEVNTNPGLEESSPLISILAPRMIDDALRLTIDDLFNDKNIQDTYISPYPVKGYMNKENMWKSIRNFGP